VNLHADTITVLSDWSAPDAEQETLRRHYLRHLRDHADAMSRHCVPGHVTASSLIVSRDQARVLLTLHARLGRWLQTGGHCEEDLHLAAAALREATEESGIPTLLIDPVPVLLSAHSEACGTVAAATHFDVQYLCLAPDDAIAIHSEESLELAWFGVDELPDRTDDSVRALVQACLARLAQSASEVAPSSSTQLSPAAADTPSR
jgi:8-oxo-dGTP pyrophosphatase MutT (NUDIX family)